jgi:protein-tyrosine phosphatase
MHSHILPKVDHGSSSVECSVEQCLKAVDAGVEVLVATPHFYMDSDSVDLFLERREHAYTGLSKAVEKPKILKAAEVTIYPGIENLHRLDELCIEGTNCILLEMPQVVDYEWVFQSIFDIMAGRGLRPIIAHIDRYRLDKIQRLFEMNVIIQVNAAALLPLLKSRCLMGLFKDNRAHLLGSDAHHSGNEYSDFKKAREKLGKLHDRVMQNAYNVITNNTVLEKW